MKAEIRFPAPNRDAAGNRAPSYLAREFRNRVLQSVDYAAKFGQDFQSADQRVAGIYVLADVVGQQMSVVGT